MDEFEKALRKKIKDMIPDSAIVGKVTSVDETNYTCNAMPLDNDAEIFKIRLKPTIDTTKKGIISIPAVDSYVIIGIIDNSDAKPFLIWCSNFKKYYIIGDGGNTLEFKDDGTILINGDSHGGLPKVVEVKNKLNAIETKINNLITVFNTWTPVANDGGAALKTALTSWVTTSMTQTTTTDLENPKVKQGAGN